TMLHLGSKAFEEIGGEVVQSTSFVLRNSNINLGKGIFLRLVDYNSGEEKRNKILEAVQSPKVSYYHTIDQKNFSEIPGSPIAYWVSNNVLKCFSNELIEDNLFPKTGVTT